MENKVSGDEAIKIMIAAYSEKRQDSRKYLEQAQADVAGLRSNANAGKRREYERRVVMGTDNLAAVEEKIHSLDTFDTIRDEYERLAAEIAKLSEQQRQLCRNISNDVSLIASQYRMVKEKGYCYSY